MMGALPWIVAAAVAALWCAVAVLPAMRATRGGTAQSSATTDAATAAAGETDGVARPTEAYLQLAGLALAAAVWILGERPGLAFAILALWTGTIWILRARRRERERVADEASALDAIAAASRALRAGIPISGMLAILASEGRGPAGRSFREIVRRESLGEDLGSALRRVLLASPIAPLRAFGLALLVHGTAGGNLAESTDRLARSLVERSRVRRRSRTITSYGRAAGFLLAVMPVAVIALMTASVEGYSEFVFDRPLGNLLVGISAALVMVGTIAMQRIARIERDAEGGGR